MRHDFPIKPMVWQDKKTHRGLLTHQRVSRGRIDMRARLRAERREQAKRMRDARSAPTRKEMKAKSRDRLHQAPLKIRKP
jgi:hypothetical protein